MKTVTREPSRKKVLVISFSQSGQLREVLRSLLEPLRSNKEIDIVDEVLRPVPPFPFPWPVYQFLDVFAESYRGVCCALETLKSDAQPRYDLVIIAYQVWYLAPSIPISSFLQSDEAKTRLHSTPIITIVACRNMWYRAHDKLKEQLRSIDARLVGHIALTDKGFNLVSVVTLVHWMLSGRKNSLLGLFPRPGIAETDLARCSVFGAIIAGALSDRTWVNVQQSLNRAGACPVVPHLMALENAASRSFNIWSKLIRYVGLRSPRSRRYLVMLFGLQLVLGLAVVVPIAFVVFYFTFPFRRGSIQRQVENVFRF